MPSGMLTPPSHSYETASVFAPEKRAREGTFYLFPVTLKKLIYILWKKVAGIGVNRGGERKKTEDLKNVGRGDKGLSKQKTKCVHSRRICDLQALSLVPSLSASGLFSLSFSWHKFPLAGGFSGGLGLGTSFPPL